jgi:hypothetical protein
MRQTVRDHCGRNAPTDDITLVIVEVATQERSE